MQKNLDFKSADQNRVAQKKSLLLQSEFNLNKT